MYDDLGNSYGLNKRELGGTNSACTAIMCIQTLFPIAGGWSLVFGPVAKDAKQVNLGSRFPTGV